MSTRTPILLAVLAAAAAACAGPGASRRAAGEPVLARVNGEAITAHELKSEFGASHQGHSRFLVAGEPEAWNFLGKLVDKHLLLQEARRMGLPDRLDVRGELAEHEAAEASRWLLRVEVEGPAAATDADVQAVYDGAIEIVDAREIRCETRAQAERALERLRAGEAFDAVAREVSTAPTRVYGGLAKSIAWGARSGEWEAVAFATPTGGTSAVFETRQGFELLRIEERRPVTKAPLAEVSGRIRKTLEARRKLDLDRRLREALFARYGAEVAEPVAADVLARVAAGGEAAGRDPDAAQPVATWRGGKLALAELAPLVNAKALAALPPERYRRVVRDLVTSAAYARLVRQEAAARGYAHAPEVARSVAARRDKIVLDLLLAEYVMKDVKVTEDDARAIFDARPEAFAAPEQRDVAHVEVATLERAREVKALLASGKAFEEVVRTHSTNEQTRAAGGALGFVTRADCPPGFEEVFSLKEGETSEPIAGKGGFHVVKVRAVAPPRPRTWDEVKEEALTALRRKRKDDALASWTKRLREVARLDYDRAAMAEFVKASAKDAEALAGGTKPLPSDHGMGTMRGHGGGAGPHGGAPPHGPVPAPAVPDTMPASPGSPVPDTRPEDAGSAGSAP